MKIMLIAGVLMLAAAHEVEPTTPRTRVLRKPCTKAFSTVQGTRFKARHFRARPRRTGDPKVNTFSIVAYDPDAQEWGVGVASKYLAVGAVVPWAKAGVGAVATQSQANPSFGPQGLQLLEQGKSPADTIRLLSENDEARDARQVGIVDARGNAATFTGPKCSAWAGGKTGTNYACQGNILAGEAVVGEMARAFEETKGALAWRIMTALEAAEKAGGDKRGKQAAAILVVRHKGGPGGYNDRMIDVRVDDHKDPLRELARILALQTCGRASE